MTVLPADHRADLQKLEKIAGEPASLETEEEFESLFPNCAKGAMRPFGNLYGLPTCVDKRLTREPLNLVATIIFCAAIIHTFLTARFRKIAHRYQRRYEAIEDSLPPDSGKKHDELIFRAELFYFMGEVEAVFGIWLLPLFVAIIAFHGWSTMVDYVGNVNVADAIFVVVIMAMASSLPILRFTETVIAKVSTRCRGRSNFMAIRIFIWTGVLDLLLGHLT
jgi:hypothetical protein